VLIWRERNRCIRSNINGLFNTFNTQIVRLLAVAISVVDHVPAANIILINWSRLVLSDGLDEKCFRKLNYNLVVIALCVEFRLTYELRLLIDRRDINSCVLV